MDELNKGNFTGDAPGEIRTPPVGRFTVSIAQGECDFQMDWCIEQLDTAKLLFHQSPTLHSDYTVTGQ